MRTHELELDGLTHGGEAVGRLPDGKACFVAYAIPGERVRVRVTESHPRWARGQLTEVVRASPDRVDPPCPYFGPTRCGGCRLQHIAPDRQEHLRAQVVAEQLERIGGLTDPPVTHTVSAGRYGYRSSARFAVDGRGRLGFRRAGTHDVLPIDRCLLLDPPTQALREQVGDGWGSATEVTLRTSPGGQSVVVRSGRRPPQIRGDEALTEQVDGLTLRVSAGSFFQSNRAGAGILTRLVTDAAAVRPGERAVDLYAGVGLFAAALQAQGAQVVAVESHPGAAADARHNLSGLAEPSARVVHADAADAAAGMARGELPADVVVADPPRVGAGPAVCRDLVAAAPRTIVYVSCDPAALARDARVLADGGYALTRAVPVDQFAQTASIEAVATFTHTAPA